MNREAKMVKSYEGHSSNGRLEILDKTRFKKRFSNKVQSNFLKDQDNRACKSKSQKGRGTS